MPGRVVKEILALSKKDFDNVSAHVEALKTNPRPVGAAKLKGRPEMKLRVGDTRILYEIDDEARMVRLVMVEDRQRVYKRLGRR